MSQRPIGFITLVTLALGLFGALLLPSGQDFAPLAEPGPKPKALKPSPFASWLHPPLKTAHLLHQHLRMPGPLALEVAASIHRHTRSTPIDPTLVVALIKVESGGNPQAVSPKEAVGLMQVRWPIWGQALGLSYRELFDVDTNIRAGVTILNHYLKELGDLKAALAAYSGDRKSKSYPKQILATAHELAKKT